MNWFTADLHLGHKNIIKYSNRPFESVEHMDATILGNLNALVAPTDTLWILGDFCMNKTKTQAYRELINCNGVKLILGNHDADSYPSRWFDTWPILHDKIAGQKMTLCHYALRTWPKMHKGSWHLYGHSHGSLPGQGRSFDVGVDCWEYKPISFDQIAAKMATLSFTPVDHQGADLDVLSS